VSGTLILPETKKPLTRMQWRFLLFLNYKVESAEIIDFLLPGLELDSFRSDYYCSLVACLTKPHSRQKSRFLKLSAESLAIRVYTKRKVGKRIHRGFVRPFCVAEQGGLRGSLQLTQSTKGLAMSHAATAQSEADLLNIGGRIEYRWQVGKNSYHISGLTKGEYIPIPKTGFLPFIVNRDFFYQTARDGSTLEHFIDTGFTQQLKVKEYSLFCDAVNTFGKDLNFLKNEPDSAVVFDGSDVTLREPTVLPVGCDL